MQEQKKVNFIKNGKKLIKSAKANCYNVQFQTMKLTSKHTDFHVKCVFIFQLANAKVISKRRAIECQYLLGNIKTSTSLQQALQRERDCYKKKKKMKINAT